MTAPNNASFEDWADAYDIAYANAKDIAAQHCPNCGAAELEMIFVLYPGEQRKRYGIAEFWCNNCLYGLLPTAGEIPEGAIAVPKGREKIPNYVIVAESEH